MLSRKLTANDLEECLAISEARVGKEIIGYTRALSVWRTLVKDVAFTSVVIESADPILGHRIVGFGATVFVSKPFARDAALNPRPGLNERIVSSIDSGRSVVLAEAELRQQNTHGCLSMVILFTNWRRDCLTPEQVAEVKLELAKSGVDLLSGYRLEQILLEAKDAIDIEYIASTGVYRMISDFAGVDSNNHGSNSAQGLFAMDEASVRPVVGSVATFVFHYARPVLRFKRGEQQLLAAAIEGLTDQELAECLDVRIQTVKKRWACVYGQVAEVMPSLLPVSNGDIDRRTRGPQKRHRVLAYLRNHPEELRPFIR